MAPSSAARDGDLRVVSQCRVSVVLPVFNEVAVIEQLTEAVSKTLDATECEYELVFVNDGSTDGSGAKLDALAAANDNVRVLHLARNFGHQAAVQSGLQAALGDAVIVMDSDMQDDPASLAAFLQAWADGADVVYAVRVKRKENVVKRMLFHGFYRVLNWLAKDPLPTDAGNFSLLDRRVVDQISQLPEVDRFFPGLRNWVGFRQQGVVVERLARYDENPRVSVWGLVRLAKSAIFGFSAVPLTVFYLIGALSMFVCLGVCIFCLYHRLWSGLAIPGWTSITISSSFFGALNALGIAVLGEYVARIYDQVRQRPTYVVGRVAGRGLASSAGQAKTDIASTQPDDVLQTLETLHAELESLAGPRASEPAEPAASVLQ